VLATGLVISALFASAIFPDKIFQRADTIVNYEEDQSATQRLMSWTVHWNIAKDHPLVGAGFEFEWADDGRWLTYGAEKYLKSFTDARKESAAAHSIYFQILGQHGFVVLFIYMWLLVSVHLTFLRIRAISRENPEFAWIGTYATGLLVGLLGYVVSGAFLSSAYFDLAWLYFALAAMLSREVTAAKVPSAGPESPSLGMDKPRASDALPELLINSKVK
jgi:probable O-glycosylation ligase (exosortase A-associated)